MTIATIHSLLENRTDYYTHASKINISDKTVTSEFSDKLMQVNVNYLRGLLVNSNEQLLQ
jgi:hypothetical protein